MIADILLSWNELTATVVVWLAVMAIALGLDFGPEMYQHNKTVKQEAVLAYVPGEEALVKYRDHVMQEMATVPLFIIQTPKTPVSKRRHAKV